jgi:CheY-like chemotaxis protein
VISTAAERAADLTRKLLAFARKGPETLVPVDVHETVNGVKQILERTIDKGIQIEVALGADHAVVKGDRSQLENAVLNLCLNARDAMPEGGRLEISTSVVDISRAGRLVGIFVVDPGRYLRLGVSDTGSGIDPALLPKVFEPFFTTKEPGKGTGLGLASVYGTVKTHGGAIDVDTDLGRGTTFHIYLPLLAGVVPAPVSRVVPPVQGSGMVLVIDDEEIVREITSRMLERLGYDVVLASNCDEGVEVLRSRPGQIDAVVLDMIMPGKSGRQCFHLMRELDPNVKVILASGYTRGEDVGDLIALGLAGFLRKPFRSSDLAKMLARAVRDKSPR